MTDTVSIDLTYPPSLNRIWRATTGANGKPRFYLAKRYETWKRVQDNLCMAEGWHKRPIKGRFVAVITLDEGKRTARSDADNRIKVVMDFLQRAGIIENDSLADEVTARWGYAPSGCRVVLSPVSEHMEAAE